jgi:hypothetical protein
MLDQAPCQHEASQDHIPIRKSFCTGPSYISPFALRIFP